MNEIKTGDFSHFYKDNNWSKKWWIDVEEGYKVVTDENLWPFFETYSPSKKTGFIFSNDKDYTLVSNQLDKKLSHQGHLGASWGCLMRCFEKIAKVGWEQFVIANLPQHKQKEYAKVTQYYKTAKTWMQTNWPNAKKVDASTFEKYNYPEYVCNWIKNTWIQYNGGYQKPKPKPKPKPKQQKKTLGSFLKKFQPGMDDINKKLVQKVIDAGEDGEKTFFKNVFTHPVTGKPMTYGEMRSFYG